MATNDNTSTVPNRTTFDIWAETDDDAPLSIGLLAALSVVGPAVASYREAAE